MTEQYRFKSEDGKEVIVGISAPMEFLIKLKKEDVRQIYHQVMSSPRENIYESLRRIGGDELDFAVLNYREANPKKSKGKTNDQIVNILIAEENKKIDSYKIPKRI